jgi:hypothetical protein
MKSSKNGEELIRYSQPNDTPDPLPCRFSTLKINQESVQQKVSQVIRFDHYLTFELLPYPYQTTSIVSRDEAKFINVERSDQ